MRILLSNDDGIHAPGLKTLEKIARELSDDVWIVAPELDQSGASHSLTLRDPLRIREISPRRFAISGTPTDCVMIAKKHILKDHPPTLVLSGINHGSNMAEDITYSGTVAAAMEAALLGIPAIALSIVTSHAHPTKWATAEHYAPDIIRRLLKIKFQDNIFVNINFPDLIASSVKGIAITKQGQRRLVGNLEEHVDPRGRQYYWIGAIHYDGSGDEGTDLKANSNGLISVTPLSLDFTHRETMKQLERVFTQS
ncbi:MAG: 5'/3'-nucleotidase SurE [Alphaproteobacteria bacterium]|jgi:5'-nucleotidase|nr:5'/3'-nucleotidase SurE [Alphaproteobacteria bacterium]